MSSSRPAGAISSSRLKRTVTAPRRTPPPPVTSPPTSPGPLTSEQPLSTSIFGTDLQQSISVANIALHSKDFRGEHRAWGYLPLVLAKWYFHSSCSSSLLIGTEVCGQWNDYQREWLALKLYSEPTTCTDKRSFEATVTTLFQRAVSPVQLLDLRRQFETPPKVRHVPSSLCSETD